MCYVHLYMSAIEMTNLDQFVPRSMRDNETIDTVHIAIWIHNYLMGSCNTRGTRRRDMKPVTIGLQLQSMMGIIWVRLVLHVKVPTMPGDQV